VQQLEVDLLSTSKRPTNCAVTASVMPVRSDSVAGNYICADLTIVLES
jgi:hypothetical protein